MKQTSIDRYMYVRFELRLPRCSLSIVSSAHRIVGGAFNVRVKTSGALSSAIAVAVIVTVELMLKGEGG